MRMLVQFFQLANAIKGLVAGSVMTSVGVFFAALYEDYGITVSFIMALCVLTILTALLKWGIEIYEYFYGDKGPMPMIEVFKLADRCGWALLEDGYDINDLCYALKEAGLNRKIVFMGSPHEPLEDSFRLNAKEEIPASHWRDFDIKWQNALKYKKGAFYDYEEDNFKVSSWDFTDRWESGVYNNLHVTGVDMKKWLKGPAKKYKGWHAKNERLSKEQFERAERDLGPVGD